MNDDFANCKVSDHMSWRRLVPVSAVHTLQCSIYHIHVCTLDCMASASYKVPGVHGRQLS